MSLFGRMFNLPFPATGFDLKQSMINLEIKYITEALRRTSGHKTEASVLLGMNRTTLVMKMKRYGMNPPTGDAHDAQVSES